MADKEVFGFEKLVVWQKSLALAVRIYRLTAGFPRNEMFGLTSQLRRAAVSVAANIAEGNTRTTGKDKARFVEVAYGSLSEIVSLLGIASAVELCSADDSLSIRADAAEISRMLAGLKRALLPDLSNL